MKRLIAFVLAVVLCLSLCACGASSAEAKPALKPQTDLPAYSDKFQLVLDNVDVDEKSIKSFMGYAVAAYRTYDAEAFCEYAYRSMDFSVFDKLSGSMSDKINELSVQTNAEAFKLSIELQNIRFQILASNAAAASWKVDYVNYKNKENTMTSEELKSSIVFAINQYALVIYGSEILI
ncbi:MAG: hypothetical protein J6L81_10470 [Clostridia bacterium]|nr:hypothetical protein [Clostridia bacterium]